MRAKLPELTRESHLVIGSRPAAVRLSAFGWYAAIALGSSVALLAGALTLWSFR